MGVVLEWKNLLWKILVLWRICLVFCLYPQGVGINLKGFFQDILLHFNLGTRLEVRKWVELIHVIFLQDNPLWYSLSRYFIYMYSTIVLFPYIWGTHFVTLLTRFLGKLPLKYLRCLVCENCFPLDSMLQICLSLLDPPLPTQSQTDVPNITL